MELCPRTKCRWLNWLSSLFCELVGMLAYLFKISLLSNDEIVDYVRRMLVTDEQLPNKGPVVDLAIISKRWIHVSDQHSHLMLLETCRLAVVI